MNHKLIASAILAALLSASPALHAQSLVGGATAGLRGGVNVGPGGLAGQDSLGRLGVRDTLRDARDEVGGSVAERRAELRELRRQQRLERVAAEATGEAGGRVVASSDEGGSMLTGAAALAGNAAGQMQGAGTSLEGTGELLGQGAGSVAGPALPDTPATPSLPAVPADLDAAGSAEAVAGGALSLARQAPTSTERGESDEADSGDTAPPADGRPAPRVRASGEANANANASASRRGASADASASARSEADIQR